jgi:probable O-glycosylation ligase (exosortase A-associated)
MRDIILVVIVGGMLPFALVRPYVGVLMWAWLGMMNPHRLTWGFAYDLPFAAIVAGVTLIGMLFSQDRKSVPLTGMTVVWFLFVLWLNVTTLFALDPEAAYPEWSRAMKIQLFSFLTVMLIRTRTRFNALLAVIALSLAFYGVKGGIFSILTGGRYRVWGPEGSFIDGNNAIGLALVMILPLLWYLMREAKKQYLRWALLGSMGLSSLAVVTTQSRGAFLAIAAMAAMLWWKGKEKVRLTIGLAILAPLILAFMPQAWWERMETIETYQQDTSALGRINAWWFAFHLSLDHPIVGGGFGAFEPELFLKYAPNPLDFHDAHSIYFEILGEQGYVGLLLFVTLGVLAVQTGRRIERQVASLSDLQWAGRAAAMLQVGLVGYAVGGAFLGLAYFDLLYYLYAALVILRNLVEERLAVGIAPAVATVAAPPEPALPRRRRWRHASPGSS